MSFEKKPITEIVDFNPKRAIKKGSVAPFIDMAALPVSSRDVDEITEKEFKSGGAKFCNGDTLFARITPCLENGKTAKVSGLDKNQNGFGSTEFIVMSAKDREHDEDYVYYLARLPEFRAYAKARMEGTSGRQRVPWQSLAEFEFPLPSKEQRKLAGNFFRAIDDKISLNTQTNQTLEQMAQAIFKSWFVDFDPVKAKMNGEQPEGMDAAAASLFPEKLVESELGLIPEGWSEQPLGKLIDFMTGFAFKSKQFTDSGVRLARGDNVKEGQFYWGDKSRYWPEVTADIEKYHLKSGDILIGMDGSKVGKNWVRVNNSDLPCLLVQRVARLREKGLIGSSMLEVIIGGNKFKRYVDNVKTGTSIPHISGKQIKDMPILYPNDGGKLFQKFEDILSPLAKKREQNNAENEYLASLRDLLLPKLLSGEIELGETEEMAEVN